MILTTRKWCAHGTTLAEAVEMLTFKDKANSHNLWLLEMNKNRVQSFVREKPQLQLPAPHATIGTSFSKAATLGR
jgi:hypothetical protein